MKKVLLVSLIMFALLIASSCASMWIMTPEQEKQQWTNFFNNKPCKDSVVVFLGFPDEIYNEQEYEVWKWNYGVTKKVTNSPAKTTVESNTSKAWYMDEGESKTTTTEKTSPGNLTVIENPRYCKIVWKNDELFSYSVERFWGKSMNLNYRK